MAKGIHGASTTLTVRSGLFILAGLLLGVAAVIEMFNGQADSAMARATLLCQFEITGGIFAIGGILSEWGDRKGRCD